jgi:hypothetical protein
MMYLYFYTRRLTLAEKGGFFHDFVEDFPYFS